MQSRGKLIIVKLSNTVMVKLLLELVLSINISFHEFAMVENFMPTQAVTCLLNLEDLYNMDKSVLFENAIQD
jgi:hypothetical protein